MDLIYLLLCIIRSRKPARSFVAWLQIFCERMKTAMFKFILCALLLVISFNGVFAQRGNLKKSLGSGIWGVRPKYYTLKDLRTHKAKKAKQLSKIKKWRTLSGRSLAVDPAVPLRASVLPSYIMDINTLFSEKELQIINNSWYFDEVKLPPSANVSPEERYLIARNNQVNMLEKLVWRARLDYFKKNSFEIARNLDVNIHYGSINYLDYIPQDVKVLYLGETHYSTKIQKEIVNVLEQVSSLYPKKEIYLLTEFFSDCYVLQPGRWLPKWLSKVYGASVWKKAHELKMNIVGVENQPLVNSLCKETFHTKFAERMDGTARRNEAWAHVVRSLMKKHPNALFIVYAGGSHVDASYYRNLPALIGEEKSFIIDFDLPDMKPVFKPLFNYMSIPGSIYQSFAKNKNSKLITFLLDEKYKKWIGFDLSVTVHMVPGEMPKGLKHEK